MISLLCNENLLTGAACKKPLNACEFIKQLYLAVPRNCCVLSVQFLEFGTWQLREHYRTAYMSKANFIIQGISGHVFIVLHCVLTYTNLQEEHTAVMTGSICLSNTKDRLGLTATSK